MGWALWQKNIMVASHVMQSFSNELNTPVSNSEKCKQTKFDTYVLILELILSRRLGLGVCHQPNINLGGFLSQLGVSCMSSHTEVLRYNKTVLSVDDWVCIYKSNLMTVFFL